MSKNNQLFFIFGLVLFLCRTAMAQEGAYSKTAPKYVHADWLPSVDSEFLKIRLAIQSKKKDMERDPQSAYDKVANEVKKSKLSNAADYFRYAITSYYCYRYGARIDRKKMSAVLDLTPDSSYECARLKFLVNAWSIKPVDSLYLGKRLILKNPDDYQVLFIYVDLTQYLSFKNKEHLEETLEYAWKLQRMFPKNAKPYALLGQVYEQAFDANGVKDYAKKAVENYEHAFKIHPLSGKQKETWDGYLARLRKAYSN